MTRGCAVLLAGNGYKMSASITLNRADVRELLKTLEKFDVDHFTLCKEDQSGIGYTLDIEYSTQINDTMVTVRIPVVGTDSW